LNFQNRLVFALVTIPDEPIVKTRTEAALGPLKTNLVLLAEDGQQYSPIQSPPLFDHPLSLETSHKGYVSFPRQDDQGQGFLNGGSLTLRLSLKQLLRSDKSAVVWNFDLLTPARPALAPPQPTSGPNPTGSPPLIDREVILSVISLLTELTKSRNYENGMDGNY